MYAGTSSGIDSLKSGAISFTTANSIDAKAGQGLIGGSLSLSSGRGGFRSGQIYIRSKSNVDLATGHSETKSGSLKIYTRASGTSGSILFSTGVSSNSRGG